MLPQSFSYEDVKAIFQLSEGAGLDGKHIGHSGIRHVIIDNVSLGDRQTFERLQHRKRSKKGGNLSLYTAFLTFHDQIIAARAVLNDPDQRQTMLEFQSAALGAPLVITNAFLTLPTSIRYAIGGGGQVFPCHHFTIWGRKTTGRPHNLHIVSCFGTMGNFA